MRFLKITRIYFFLFMFMCILKVRGNFQELGLTFHRVGLGIWTQMVKLSNKCLYPLSPGVRF